MNIFKYLFVFQIFGCFEARLPFGFFKRAKSSEFGLFETICHIKNYLAIFEC